MSRGLIMLLAFSIGFGAFMFVFALTVHNGLHADALHGGLAIVPMAALFFAGSLVAPRLITRLYLTLLPDGVPSGFATTEYVHIGIVALLAAGAAALPKLTR